MSTPHTPDPERYNHVPEAWFRKCGRWGLKLPAISLGCWHNFGEAGTDSAKHNDEAAMHENCRQMLFTAFDLGITHFDLANNYGPPPGAAEQRVGRILKQLPRDELIISTKAAHRMWPGPYGEFNSRKSLLASLDKSLQRLDLDYVDIYYSHRPDPADGTPLEETLAALDHAVRCGKALYTGISSYRGDATADVVRICDTHGFSRPIIHQPSYNMFNRRIESDLLPHTDRHGMGVIAFCPLAQGLLTDRYLDGIPADSRASQTSGFLKRESVSPQTINRVKQLNEVAQQRGQTLAQMAIAWILRLPQVTSALIGASRPAQIRDNAKAVDSAPFSDEALERIEQILAT